MTASLNATLASANMGVRDLTFETLNGAHVTTVLSKLASITGLPRAHIDKDDLEYLFHLEAELWGIDHSQYVGFFQDGGVGQSCAPLQTCLFAHAFFLLERWLHVFIPAASRASKGRPGMRRDLFGKDRGILTVRHKDCLAALGPPYNLVASPTTVTPVQSQVGTSNEWTTLRNVPVPDSLRSFYRSVSKHDHFVDIIESSFKSSRSKLPRHLVKRPRDRRELRRESRGLIATWYDVLWMYSESVRYRPIWPSQASLGQPFYWNRSLRWCTSTILSGIICLVRKANPRLDIGSPWNKAIATNPLLGSVFGSSRDLIVH